MPTTVTKVITKGSKNRLVRTENFEQSSWIQFPASSHTITTDSTGTLDPLNGNSAELVQDTNGTSFSTLYQEIASAELTANNYYTFSVYLKPNNTTKSRIYVEHRSGTNSETVRAEIDWTALTVTKTINDPTSAMKFTNVDFRADANGFYRVSVTLPWITAGGNLSLRCAIQVDFASTSSTNSAWVWGAQFEEGAHPTWYLGVVAATDPLAGDYKTIQEFITASDINLITADQLWVGQLRDETYYITASLAFHNANTDSTRYRRLEAHPSCGPYDPVTNTGPKIVYAVPASSSNAAIRIGDATSHENFFDLSGIGIFLDFESRPSSGITDIININKSDYCRIWNCFLSAEKGFADAAGGNFFRGIFIDGQAGNLAVGNCFYNTIIRGAGQRYNRGLLNGVEFGVNAQAGGFYNCIIYGTYNTAILGHVFGGGGPNSCEVVNCIAIDCGIEAGSGDYTGFFKRFDNNISSDNTAIAGGREGSGTPADANSIGYISSSIFIGAQQNDFRLYGGSTPIDRGSNETTVFTTARSSTAAGGPLNSSGAVSSNDRLGVSRAGSNQLWDIGPYEGAYVGQTHSLDSKLTITNTGATSLENGNGDTRIRVESTKTARLNVNDTLTISGAAGTYTVVKTRYFTGTTGTPDVRIVQITPALSGIGGAGTLAEDAVVAPTPGAGTFKEISYTVGLDKTRNYGSLGQFIGDLPGSLYHSNHRYKALCYADGIEDIGTNLGLHYYNTVTSTSNNIVIEGQTKLITKANIGHRIRFDAEDDANTRHRALLWISCDNTEVSNLILDQVSTAASGAGPKNARVVELFANKCKLDSLFMRFDSAYTRTIGEVIDIEGTRDTLTNCISRGHNTTGNGPSRGFLITNSSVAIQLLHCVAYRIRGGTNGDFSGNGGRAFSVGNNATFCRISGCIALETATSSTGTVADYFFGSGVTGSKTMDYSFSGDTTAVGAGSEVSKVASNIFQDAANNDYRLKKGSQAVNKGTNLSGIFSKDILGQARFAPYDLGVYEGIVFSPLLAAPRPKDHHRFMSLFDIIRSDGIGHFFCTGNEPLEYRGQTYTPTGQPIGSARRMEAALKEHNLEVVGAIVSNEILAEDLAAGLFRGARVTERIIDWKYPFTLPYKTRIYTVAQVEFDHEQWRAELVGPTAKLDQRIGELIGTTCEYDLGDEDCQFDLSTVTEVNISVATVVTAQREFTCTISTSRANDYFGVGKVIWTSGLNAGIISEIKASTGPGTTQTIKLIQKTPKTIAVSDKFDLVPGCRLRYLLDCVAKFNNGINFGGRMTIPGTDRGIQTPIR